MADKVDDQTEETVVDVPVEKTDEPNEMVVLMEEFGFDSPQELKDAITGGFDLKKELGDRKVGDLIKDQDEKKSWEKKWDADKQAKLKETEDPEDTVKRLEKELKDKDNLHSQEQASAKKVAEAKTVIKNFESHVSAVVDKVAVDLNDGEREFVTQYLGINNPFNSIDIDNKVEVKKMATSGIKAFGKLKQQIIKDYVAGKTDIPNVTETVPAGPATPEKPKLKIKESGKSFLEKLLAGNK